MTLSGDVQRFTNLSKKKDLSQSDFGHRDLDILKGMAHDCVPQNEVKKVDADGLVETRIVPNFSGYSDEVSLIKLLKQKGKL